MLSFIYKLVHDFAQEHEGLMPNLIYLSPLHLKNLKSQLASQYRVRELPRLLGMEVVVTKDAIHPHVVWHNQAKAG